MDPPSVLTDEADDEDAAIWPNVLAGQNGLKTGLSTDEEAMVVERRRLLLLLLLERVEVNISRDESREVWG